MIFSSAIRLLLSSASTVESLARVDSPSRSRSTSRATADAASSMALMALSKSRRSRSSIRRILLPEPVSCVVTLRDQVSVDHRPEADHGHQDPPDQDGRQRRVDQLHHYKDDALEYLPVVDLS